MAARRVNRRSRSNFRRRSLPRQLSVSNHKTTRRSAISRKLKFPRAASGRPRFSASVFRRVAVANGADPINSSGFPVPPEARRTRKRARTSAFDHHPALSQPPLFITVQLVPGSRKKLAAAVVPPSSASGSRSFVVGQEGAIRRAAESLRISHARSCYPDAPRSFAEIPPSGSRTADLIITRLATLRPNVGFASFAQNIDPGSSSGASVADPRDGDKSSSSYLRPSEKARNSKPSRRVPRARETQSRDSDIANDRGVEFVPVRRPFSGLGENSGENSAESVCVNARLYGGRPLDVTSVHTLEWLCCTAIRQRTFSLSLSNLFFETLHESGRIKSPAHVRRLFRRYF